MFSKREQLNWKILNWPEIVQHANVNKIFKKLGKNLHCFTEEWHGGQKTSATDVKMLPDMRRSDRFSFSEHMHALAALLDSDIPNWRIKCAPRSKVIPGHEKDCITMGIYYLTVMQKWLRYDTARNDLEHYEPEGVAFVLRTITLKEIRTKSYKLQLKRQSNK